MARFLFGTDGIRGEANRDPLTPETIMRIAMAAGAYFKKTTQANRVVIGKDTRISGYMIEPSLTAGFVAQGLQVILVGPLPTPAIAMLTKSLRAAFGVVISASHNPYPDNGIKFFGADGYKLSDEAEHEIEALFSANHFEQLLSKPDAFGKAERLEEAKGRYIEFLKNTLPKNTFFEGIKIVLDCANGAAYKVAPRLFWELGIEVITIGTNPNGRNINESCGATYPTTLAEAVVLHQADLGIAFDGDADRIIMVDETGTIIDGDQLMAALALHFKQHNRLARDMVVATQMSNMGLEAFLHQHGIQLTRTQVGDRYVMEAMRQEGAVLGGEQSGHLILNEFSTTGDGLLAALHLIDIYAQQKQKASATFRLFQPFPQVLRNIRLHKNDNPLENAEIQSQIQNIENTLRPQSRLYIRKSGTEPLLRIMMEAENLDYLNHTIEQISEIFKHSA